MKVSDALDQYRYALLGKSDQYQTWIMARLHQFADWCELHDIQLEQLKAIHLRKYVHHISQRPHHRTGKPLSSYTVHGHARAVRAFLHWCTKEEDLDTLISQKTVDNMTMPTIEVKVIEIFTPEHLKALLTACERESTPTLCMRDKAIVSVLIDTGIRAGELCGLTLDHVYLDPRDAYIKVLGKGKKEREVPLGKKASAILHKYITRVRKAPKEEQHVFLSRFTRPFTVSGLVQVVERLGIWAHIDGVRCSCHTFRHTYAVNYLKSGGDVFKLSRLLGHEHIEITTAVYLRAFKAMDARNGGSSLLDNL
jgi:integrase/recombinase XerD